MRLAAVLVSAFMPVLAALWLAGTAGAQGSLQGSHSHGALSAQELVAGIAHGATQGTVVFLAGLVAFVALVWLPVGRTEDAVREKSVGLFCRWMRMLVGLLVVAGLVELPLYAVRASGEALSLGLLREALFDTRVGQLWTERLLFGVLVVAAATYAARTRRPAYWWGAALVAGALLLMTLTQQSHAAAEGRLLPFAADWLHATAASLWMGGLLGFPVLLIGSLRAVPTETRAKLLSRTVRRFSKVATISVITIIITGLYAALLHVPSLSALIDTPYGNALSMKLGLLTFLLALGAQNLRLQGRGPFDRLVSAELILAIGIFLATGFLTSLPPAEDVSQPPTSPPTLSSTTGPSDKKATSDVVVRVSGTPGTRYSGIYGTIGRTQPVDGTLGAEPTDYEAKIDEGVSAAFRKTQPGEGTLKVEIMTGGEVVAERETSAESGTVDTSWSMQTRTTGESP